MKIPIKFVFVKEEILDFYKFMQQHNIPDQYYPIIKQCGTGTAGISSKMVGVFIILSRMLDDASGIG